MFLRNAVVGRSDGSEASSDDEASIADISGAQPAFEHASVGLCASLFSFFFHCSSSFSRALPTVADGVANSAGKVEEDDGMTVMSPSCQDPLLARTYLSLPLLPWV